MLCAVLFVGRGVLFVLCSAASEVFDTGGCAYVFHISTIQDIVYMPEIINPGILSSKPSYPPSPPPRLPSFYFYISCGSSRTVFD